MIGADTPAPKDIGMFTEAEVAAAKALAEYLDGVTASEWTGLSGFGKLHYIKAARLALDSAISQGRVSSADIAQRALEVRDATGGEGR